MDRQTAERRARELLGAMTLQEKIGQTTQVDLKALKNVGEIGRLGLGSVLSGGDSDPPDITPAGWLRQIEECHASALASRLRIPLLYGIDAVHGHAKAAGAVVFPHNIGLGAGGDAQLVEQAARITAFEASSTGVNWVFAPCIAVVQDPRWGRTYETFGSDPDLVGRLGAAVVRGLQGPEFNANSPVLGCAKHFIADGGTVGGVDQGNAVCDEAKLRRIHLPGYVQAISAGVGSIMVSYSSWNGKKMHGNRQLITELLKGELGFDGIVVSDWAAVDQLNPDFKLAIEAALNAGIDMVMIPFGADHPNSFYNYMRNLEELVDESRVAVERIDDAVFRILSVKARMGLFDSGLRDHPSVTMVGCDEHRRIARECARGSIVVLRNEGGMLPLSRSLSRLHVTGSGAVDLGIQCGGWTLSWQGKLGLEVPGATSLLAAIRQAVDSACEVTYSVDGSGADGSDAVVAVLGEGPYAEMKGDRSELSPSAQDLELLRRVRDSGVPVVAVLYSGRPLEIQALFDLCDALVAAWLPGSEAQGVTDILFGDVRPTGRLPLEWRLSREGDSTTQPDQASLPARLPIGYGLSW